MTRLPQPGADDGQWGGVLNDFLLQAHQSDGQLRGSAVGAMHLQSQSVGTAAIANDSIIEAKLAVGVRDKLNVVNPPGPAGVDGKSAYELAVEDGFLGTQAQWLASLKGESTGGSGLLIGTGPNDAKAGNYAPSLADIPAGITLTVMFATTWPARPTSRTDIRVNWIGGSSLTQPTGALVGDLWIRDANSV